jgi:molybdate transport system regulatory protein
MGKLSGKGIAGMPTHKDFAKRHRSAGLRPSETLRGPPVQNARAVARSNGGFGADASQPAKMPANATAGIKVSIVLGSGTQIGPDKIALLESIRDAGSISGAARDLGIQYKRAWMLLDNMNRAFKQPVVKSIIGGAYAGAVLTPFGADLLEHYRRILAAAETATAADLVALGRAALRDADPKVRAFW